MRTRHTDFRTLALALFASFALLFAVPLTAQDEPYEPPIADQIEADAERAADEVEETADRAGDRIERTADDVEADLDQAFDDDDELPRTASPLALILLTGIAGLGTAAGLRRQRK